MSGSTKSVICVAVCDRWIGFGIARALLSSQKRDGEYVIRAIGRDMRCMKELEKFGAEVIQIDYDNCETLERACQGCTWMIMISEVEEDRVNMAKTFVNICRKVDVPNLCFLSMLGAEDASEKSLCDFREIERCVESMVNHWTIMRVSEEGVLALPIRSRDRMAPIHFDDLQCVLHHLLFREDGTLIPRMDSEHRKKHYILTGPGTVDGETMVQMLNKVLDRDDGGICFKEITREECEKYLRQACEPENDATTDFIGRLLQRFKQLWFGTPDDKGDEVRNDREEEEQDDTQGPIPPHCLNDIEILFM
ncbi:2671_t:CDS:2 [Acaulospora colombiana]|uniref:2671_t:CDS:1 n=1 Tax=Acaulospora colombiana TaxID=27376 RepID=A0ACA9K301_9GLOM|nr:2671_t:CDS:2 [Acaulospora colombiana]